MTPHLQGHRIPEQGTQGSGSCEGSETKDSHMQEHITPGQGHRSQGHVSVQEPKFSHLQGHRTPEQGTQGSGSWEGLGTKGFTPAGR